MSALKWDDIKLEDDRWREFSFLLFALYAIRPSQTRLWPLESLTYVMEELHIAKENVPYLLCRLEEVKKLSSIVH